MQTILDKHLANHQSFQSVIVAVGELLRIEKYYVSVNDKLFNVDSTLGAVDLALKIFFSLDCAYPENSKTIWVFIQRVLFNLELPTDVVTIDGNAVIGHIRNL